MKYKVLPVDEDGFVNLTAKELEDMLEEAYNEGKNSAKPEIVYVPQYIEPYKGDWWQYPYITWTAAADSSGSIGKNTATYTTSNTTANTETIKGPYTAHITPYNDYSSVTYSKPEDMITYTK